jgi:hypothetical protein
MSPGKDRPPPRLDQDTSDNEMIALGALCGSLTQAGVGLYGEDGTVIMQMVLARTAEDHPRLFMRFPGMLKSEYEVTLHLVPDTATEVDDQSPSSDDRS